MAQQKTSPVRSKSPKVTVIAGRFRPNGGSAITMSSTTAIGDGWTVSRTGTGTFTITLTGYWTKLQSFVAQPQLNAASAGSIVEITGAVTHGATGTTIPITNLLNAAGVFSAADVASHANAWIHFVAVVSDTAEVS
jgi:hypothetical protein